MMRRALAATVAATVAVGVLVAAPVVASAPTTVTGTPTAAAAVAVRPAALSAAATSAAATSAPATPGPGAHSGAAPGAAAAAHAKHHQLRWLRAHRIALAGVLHAQWTTKTKDGPVVTHDAIRGTVGAVSGGVTTFTVTAVDKVSQTYSTSAATKVWTVTRTDGKPHLHKATVAAITHGADVVVEGTGSGAPYAATRVLVRVAG